MTIHNPDPVTYQTATTGSVFIRLRRGVLKGSGVDRLDLLHRLSTNATRQLEPGEETSTILTSDKGRIIEVIRVIADDEYLLMVLSGNDVEQVRAWLDKYTIMDDFATEDRTADYEVIGVYGEHAKSLVARAFGAELPNAGKFSRIELDGGSIIVLREPRLTGAGGFLLLVPAALGDDARDRLGAIGLEEIDSDTYETLRIEAGIPAYGREISENYNPLEAGLTQYVSFSKGCYIGQEVIARLDTYDKVQRHLVGLEFSRSIELAGGVEAEVHDAEERKKIGTVTSLAYSPRLERTIGLAYIRTAHAVPGLRVVVVAGGEEVDAVITRLPFDR